MKNILLIGGSYGIGLAIAKEMQFENEAMRAKGEQQRLAAENNAMRENQILEGLKNGQIDEKTAFDILGDKNISQEIEKNIVSLISLKTHDEKIKALKDFITH